MRKIAALTLVTAGLMFAAPSLLRADDDDHQREHQRRRRGSGAILARTASLPAYEKECGSCHLAFPPGMLPARSWLRMLEGLDAHFDQNAELEAEPRAEIAAWLVTHAAEAGTSPWSRKVLKASAGATPLRISELGFMRHEHDEIRRDVWARPTVQSRANCGACHLDAEQWAFDEDRARIPR